MRRPIALFLALIFAVLALTGPACRSLTGPKDQADCTFGVAGDPTSNLSAAGATLTFKVTADSGCEWTTRSSSDFVQFSVPGGTGSLIFKVTVPPNIYGDRYTNLTIANTGFLLTQKGSGTNPPTTVPPPTPPPAPTCSYSLSPRSVWLLPSGGRATFTVQATGTGCNWTAAVSDPFIEVRSGASGSGSGEVVVEAQAYTGDARDGRLTVGGQTSTVYQAGSSVCISSIAPQSQTFPASGGAGAFEVQAPPTCDWTMIVNDSFLTPQTGVIRGSGTARYAVSANTSSTARFGTITIGGRLVNIDQAPLTRASGSN